MCGIAGFAGIDDVSTRAAMAIYLGSGIDERGGHAAGFVTLDERGVHTTGHKLGHWMSAKDKFIRNATAAHTSMMHARFATCGKRVISEAHPFAVKRKGKTVLHGCHNGVLYNARESAIKNGRKYDVDSRELFELLADNDLAAIQRLEGYGVITWIDMARPTVVNVARLSADSDLYVAETACGAYLWGSTDDIVHEAAYCTDMHIARSFNTDEVGRVFTISRRGVFKTSLEGIHVAKREAFSFKWKPWDDDDDLLKQWENEEEEHELDRLAAEAAERDTVIDPYADDDLDELNEWLEARRSK